MQVWKKLMCSTWIILKGNNNESSKHESDYLLSIKCLALQFQGRGHFIPNLGYKLYSILKIPDCEIYNNQSAEPESVLLNL